MFNFKPESDFDRDSFFMQQAFKEAEKAFAKDEVPIGAVIVLEGKIVARAYNQVEMLKDATAHAEMIALTQAQSYIGDWRLSNMTLYVTKEPCVMCTGAIILSRISKVVYGVSDVRFGGMGSFVDIVSQQRMGPKLEVKKEVLSEESLRLLKTFFQEKREK